MFKSVPLGVAMVGLRGEQWGSGGARELIERLGRLVGGEGAACGMAAQIDARHAELRPRELDRSARRDLAAMFKRVQIPCCGLDLLIPPGHFADSASVDKAVASVIAAIEMCAELRSLGATIDGASVSIELNDQTPVGVVAAIEQACQRVGVRVADVGHGGLPRSEWIGVAVDPAGAFARGERAEDLAARVGRGVVSARISDVARGAGALRCEPGAMEGRLDLQAYGATLGVIGYRGAAVIDLRGVAGADGAMISRIVDRWAGS